MMMMKIRLDATDVEMVQLFFYNMLCLDVEEQVV